MRSDLVKLPGISDIKTDIKTTSGSFKIPMKQEDLKARLDEFAKTNEHIKGWSFAQDTTGASNTAGG